MKVIDLFVYFILIVLPIVQLVRDWKYEQKSRTHHVITRIMVVPWLMAACLSVFLYWEQSIESAVRAKQTTDLLVGQTELLRQNSVLVSKVDTLDTRNEGLNKKIDGLTETNLQLTREVGKYQLDLEKKNVEVRALQQQAKTAARGISYRYDFNGAKRYWSSGTMQFEPGEETNVFQKMIDLENAKEYAQLAILCRKSIESSPTWLTPFFFLGIAEANLGRRTEAIKAFQHVVDYAPGDKDYEQAKTFLERLKAP